MTTASFALPPAISSLQTRGTHKKNYVIVARRLAGKKAWEQARSFTSTTIPSRPKCIPCDLEAAHRRRPTLMRELRYQSVPQLFERGA